MRKIILVCNYKMLVETDFAGKSSSILSHSGGLKCKPNLSNFHLLKKGFNTYFI